MLAACPPEDLRIEISAQGATILVGSCTQPDAPNAPVCSIGHALPSPASQLSARLYLIAADSRLVRAKSACMPLFRCGSEGQNGPTCFAEGLNQALDGAMRDG